MMPLVITDPDQKDWKQGASFIGKVMKPGCKAVIQGNGRVSLRFSVRIPCGTPFQDIPSIRPRNDFYIRCIWFDPDFMLNTGDVVKVVGILTWAGNDLGICVNEAKVIARFVITKSVKAVDPCRQ